MLRAHWSVDVDLLIRGMEAHVDNEVVAVLKENLDRCTMTMKNLQKPDPVDGSTADNAMAGTDACRPRRVLVVDDERLTRWSVVETLAEQGYEVTEASDAASAIDAFHGCANDADVVLLDLWLPDSNDLGVLSAICRRSPSTPVIVMTAYGSPELSEAARRLGAFAVMDKPFEMDALAPLVRRAITIGSLLRKTPIDASWHGGQPLIRASGSPQDGSCGLDD